jgi:hypothetical protein
MDRDSRPYDCVSDTLQTYFSLCLFNGVVRGSVVGSGTMLQTERSPVRVPDDVDFSIYLILPAARTMALGSTQPLTEMSTRNFPGGKGRPSRRADNLTAICEPNV